ncbi:hypothetical protein HRI_002484800 [Hibiscus trionum]|uniref:PGG domain-containing protein n=1 Tax=Hibiscus trionum TaxID=183268 RepID=A0A9W7I142_HIBTR|nr:hypothetical protein HRI_002484800 [Hibiscus trionum]
MDENLSAAARTGNVGYLYRLIRLDGNALRRFDDVEFVDTPLHIAAEAGCIGFAMEIMNLKPSFARKLNQDGLSPMHLAVKKGHVEMALRFVEMDKDLVRVKGKSGKTPLHLISKVGNRDGLLDRILEVCPECIPDVTIKNRTALHIATKNNRLDVLQVLIRMLRKKDYDREVVNRKDEDGNTALHTAATTNQPQILKLLLDCNADKHATNLDGSTALDVAQRQNNREIIGILRGCSIPRVSNFKHKLEKQTVKYLTKASSIIFSDMDNISGDDRNALLVILGLLLTATYQATLSPPGGVCQDESCAKPTKYIRNALGTSILPQYEFLMFYVPTYVVFIVTFFLTLALLKPFPNGFRTALQVLLAFFVICFHQSIIIIASAFSTVMVINTLSAIVFILMVFMCITYELSKISVSIVGYRIFTELWPSFPNMLHLSDEETTVVASVILGLFLFLFLFDKFWQGTILVVGYGLGVGLILLRVGNAGFYTQTFLISSGSWFFFNLCRICIKGCIRAYFSFNCFH